MRVDRENNTIHGVVAMQGGVEALGHGCMSDRKTLEMMATLASQIPGGVLMRFGHPGASDNAMGHQVARAVNHRVETDSTGRDALVHDAEMITEAAGSPVFARDPIEYLLNMAERQPQNIGESVVILADEVWVQPDGSEEPVWIEDPDSIWGVSENVAAQESSIYDLPVLRPTRYWNVDFVMEGALTHNGLFSQLFDGTGHAYADQAFQFVDQWREQFNIPLENVPRKVSQVVGRYLEQRGFGGNYAASEIRMKLEENVDEQEEPIVPAEDATLETDADDEVDVLDEATRLLEDDEDEGDEHEADEVPSEGESAFATRRDYILMHRRLAKQDEVIALQSKHIKDLKASAKATFSKFADEIKRLKEVAELDSFNGQSGAGFFDEEAAKLQRTRKAGSRPSKALQKRMSGRAAAGAPSGERDNMTPQEKAVEHARSNRKAASKAGRGGR